MKYILIVTTIFLFYSCKDNRLEQVEFVANELERSFVAKDYTYLNELTSFERIMEKAYIRLRVPYSIMKSSVANVKSLHTLSDYIFQDDYAASLHVVSYDEERITVAIRHQKMIVNYFDLFIKPVNDELKIVDVYLYHQGLRFSDELLELTTILKNEPKQLDNFYLYLHHVRDIYKKLREYDVIEAKAYYQPARDSFPNSKLHENLLVTMAAYDLNKNHTDLFTKYIEKDAENAKHIAYLHLVKNMYRYECDNIQQSIEELWQYTGVDSFTLKYHEACLNQGDYIR